MTDLIERLRFNADVLDRGGLHSGLSRTIREAATALEAAREDAVDAARWRHARKLLTVDDIEGSQRDYDYHGRRTSEEECKRADAAIDAAVEAVGDES